MILFLLLLTFTLRSKSRSALGKSRPSKALKASRTACSCASVGSPRAVMVVVGIIMLVVVCCSAAAMAGAAVAVHRREDRGPAPSSSGSTTALILGIRSRRGAGPASWSERAADLCGPIWLRAAAPSGAAAGAMKASATGKSESSGDIMASSSAARRKGGRDATPPPILAMAGGPVFVCGCGGELWALGCWVSQKIRRSGSDVTSVERVQEHARRRAPPLQKLESATRGTERRGWPACTSKAAPAKQRAKDSMHLSHPSHPLHRSSVRPSWLEQRGARRGQPSCRRHHRRGAS